MEIEIISKIVSFEMILRSNTPVCFGHTHGDTHTHGQTEEGKTDMEVEIPNYLK